MACMILSLVGNDDLSHFDGFRFQKTMYGNEISESIERYSGEAYDGCLDMHRRDTTIRYVGRFSAEDERATHCYTVVIKNDGRWKKDIAF